MLKETTWDNVQDGAKLLLSTAVIVTAPQVGVAFKFATIAIGVVNRVFKITNLLSDNQNVWDTINKEQQNAFENAWKRTHTSINEDTKLKISSQLEAILGADLKLLNSYSVDEIDLAFKNAIKDYKRFSEWTAQASDVRAVFDLYKRYYDEEVLSTKILKVYYNSNQINDLIDSLKKTKEQIKNIENRLFILESTTKDFSYSFSAEDIEYYFAWLNNYYDDRIHLYTDVNVEGFFEEDINQLITMINSPTWKEEVISLLQKARSALDEDTGSFIKLIQGMDIISGSVKYDVAFQIANDITHSLKWSSQIGKGFISINQKYNKVIIISGEPGSGKTHFIREYLKYLSQERYYNIFAIPLEFEELVNARFQDNSSLEVFLLNKINDCFHTKLQSLSSLLLDTKSRIVFTIDNFHRVFIYHRKLFDLILHNIEELTKYDYIYWMITMNEQDLYALNRNSNIIKKYCIKFLFTTMHLTLTRLMKKIL
jgi:hypothetical protein